MLLYKIFLKTGEYSDSEEKIFVTAVAAAADFHRTFLPIFM